MVWQPEIDELNRRKKMAEQMGGAAGIEVQHQRAAVRLGQAVECTRDLALQLVVLGGVGWFAPGACRQTSGVGLLAAPPPSHARGLRRPARSWVSAWSQVSWTRSSASASSRTKERASPCSQRAWRRSSESEREVSGWDSVMAPFRVGAVRIDGRVS